MSRTTTIFLLSSATTVWITPPDKSHLEALQRRPKESYNEVICYLLEMEPGRSLLAHIALIQDLEEALGCKVDVMTEKALKERYRKRVLDVIAL